MLADLHRHLDGSLRPSTLAELAARHGRSVLDDLPFVAGMGLGRTVHSGQGHDAADEHELQERLAWPEHYRVRDPRAVRAEGERVVEAIEAGRFPFDGTWCDFQPDPGWSVPTELPVGWDRPRAREPEP